MGQKRYPSRSSRLDAVAAAASRVLPRQLTPSIDQLRNDVRMVHDRAVGDTPSPLVEPNAIKPLDEIDPLDVLPRRIAESVRRIRGDVKIVTDRLIFGKGPTPMIRRTVREKPASVVSLPQASPSLSRPLRVAKVVRETKDAVSIYLTEEDGSPIAFEPGQFLSVDVEVDGKVLRRAYSLASPSLPDADAHITVKRMPEGRVSNHLNDHIKEGDTLDVLGPSGNFTVSPSPMLERHLIMIAGGSGITPIMSILHTVLTVEKHSSVTLLFGNRGEEDIIFKDRLEALQEEFPDRLTVKHVLQEPPNDWTGGTGMLTQDVIDELLTVEDTDACRYFVCGPTPMMDAAHALLDTRQVPKKRVFEERFTHPEDRTANKGSDSTQLVVVHANGKEHGVQVQPGQTVLEAALAANVALPFSCAMGGCGACRVRCTSGDIAVDEPNCLSSAEREQGYVLTCVGRPMSLSAIDVER